MDKVRLEDVMLVGIGLRRLEDVEYNFESVLGDIDEVDEPYRFREVLPVYRIVGTDNLFNSSREFRRDNDSLGRRVKEEPEKMYKSLLFICSFEGDPNSPSIGYWFKIKHTSIRRPSTCSSNP